MLISKESLLAHIAEAKAKNKKIQIVPIIEAEAGVEAGVAEWIEGDLPAEPCQTFVKVHRPFGPDYVTVASYSPSGYHNGGRNKWDVEQVVGPTAGHTVYAWYPVPTL